MAVLSSNDRTAVGALIQSDWSNERVVVAGVTKADIQAAVAAADDWANTNAASFNSALPVATRTNLTAAQKARLLMYVIRQRYVAGA